jgi:hypothetical protein
MTNEASRWSASREAMSGGHRVGLYLDDPGDLYAWVQNLADSEAQALVDQVNGAPAAPSEGDGRPPVHLLLDIWQAIGGESEDFHPWWAADPSFPDRWSQIVAAVDGNFDALAKDTNPPAGDLLPLARDFHGQPLTPAAPLPPGVHRAPDGRLWWTHGYGWPEGYQRRGRSSGVTDMAPNTPRAGTAIEVWPTPVPPVPEPERVHYLEAVGRLVPGEDEPIQVAVGWGVSVRADAAIHVVQADADGLVSVLPLGDPK